MLCVLVEISFDTWIIISGKRSGNFQLFTVASLRRCC